MYVIGKTSTIEGPGLEAVIIRSLRDRFLDTFVAAAAEPGFAAVLPAVTEWRKRDENVTPTEQAELDRLLARVTLER
jgi:hypothetical protein